MKRPVAIVALSLSLVAPSANPRIPRESVFDPRCRGRVVLFWLRQGNDRRRREMPSLGRVLLDQYKAQYVKYGFKCSGSPARLHKR